MHFTDEYDNGQARRTAGATTVRMKEPTGTIPTCAACGSPRPTDAKGADIDRQFAELKVVLSQAKAICERGLAAHEAWKAARGVE